MRPRDDDSDCQNPPDDETLAATATELAHVMNSMDLLKRLRLSFASASIVSSFLATCSRLESVSLSFCESYPLMATHIFSIPTLRQLYIPHCDFPDSESVNAFCLGIETSSLDFLFMHGTSFSSGHQAQVATTLARCETLKVLHYQGASPSFCNHFCVALSNNFDTKLEWLHLKHTAKLRICFKGEGGTAKGIEPTVVAKIRNLLKLNVQRKTCPRKFAAIGKARSDAERKQRMVKAFKAVDIPVVFEYITANQSNLIALIQRLGRSRKRNRED